MKVPDRPFVTLRLERADAEEDPEISLGDRLEIALDDFSDDLSAAPDDRALRISDLRNLRYDPARGLRAPSYRVRVIGMTESDDGDLLLHVVEEQRGNQDYGAIPMPS